MLGDVSTGLDRIDQVKLAYARFVHIRTG